MVDWNMEKSRNVREYAKAFWGKSESAQADFAKAKVKAKKNRKKKLAKRAKGKEKAKSASKAATDGSGRGKGKKGTGSKATTANDTSDEDRSDTNDEAVQDAVDAGRKEWNKWSASMFTKWKINALVDKVMKAEGKDPISVMRKLHSLEVCR